ncbi:two-component system response regulator [Gammaproteobacteria bacterium 45_16_T64]|nr:two-component system response regulator [Gammaproteobacteria bacterium 45_16_T64]
MPPIRILIVDDALSQRFVIKEIISGYDDIEIAGEAEDGAKAIEQFELLQPDIVLLDLVMPVLGGKAALEKILELNSKAKVVIASSLGGEEDIEECLRTGAIAFVQKPYDQEDLIRAIRLAN